MGKTIGFYFALFWHWRAENTVPENKKIVLVIVPLNALLQGQVNSYHSLY